jgi:ABC-type antimicrobial peptide transport system permease subunit
LGLLLGFGIAFLLGRLLRSQLYGITPQDPATHALVIGTLGAIGLMACLIPALRAARVHPAEALRSE